MNKLTLAQIEELILLHYNIKAEITPLAGEVDYNYHLKTSDHREYLLKISRPYTPLQSIDFPTKILQHLATQTLVFDIPQIVHNKAGNAYVEIEQEQYLRLQAWVSGNMVGDWKRRSPELLQSWGETTAQLCQALQNFDHSEAHRF